jgi:class 3 adenylate cyclase
VLERDAVTDAGFPRTTFRGFMFADLRGYSAYVERHGDQAGVELLRRYRELVRSALARFDGAEIRTEGDSFYVVFTSASSAVSCAMEIIGVAGKTEPPIEVGVGIHAGEAADTGEGPVGSAVNIAARVCARAAAGEILVTDTVRAVTRTVLPFRYVPRGVPALKGIAEPIRLFAVLPSDGAAAPAGRRPEFRAARLWAAAVGGVAVLGLVLVAIVFSLLSRAATPRTGTDSSPPSAGSGPTLAASSTGPTGNPQLTPAEADLIGRLTDLQPEQRAACRSATADEAVSGASVSVTCPFPTGTGPSELRLDLFDQPSEMLTAFTDIVSAHGSPSGDCSASATGYATWAVPRVSQGHVLCYPSGGQSFIVWTYDGGDGAGILGRASRNDLLWQQLDDWWQEFHALITH